MNLTDGFKWVETRLDEGAWFRRIYLMSVTGLVFKVTFWAMDYADRAVVLKADPSGVAMVVGAVSAVAAALLGHGFSCYLDSRESRTP